MAEKKIADGTVPADETEFVSDTTGNEPLQGVRHVMQEDRVGVVDQEENLREAKDAGSSPENKAAAAPARKSSGRK